MNDLSTLLGIALDTKVSTTKPHRAGPEIVHDLILSRLPRQNQPLASAAAHHFEKPGKMLRASMVMQCASLLSIDQTAASRWAAAIEVLHNASLIHDDICDGDKLRRGRQAVWAKFGRNVALTLGDWLIALAFELAAEAAQISKTPRLVPILARHMSTTTAGEAMEFECHRGHNWDSYLKIAADKTAPLLTAPLQGVTIMAGDTTAEAKIWRYFRDLGKAYQIANDILNFLGSDGAKLVAGDLARRAPNAVILSYASLLSSPMRAQFDTWLNDGDNGALDEWQSKIINSNAISDTARRMVEILDDAQAEADTLAPEIGEIIAPVHALIMQICSKSAKRSYR